MRFLHYSGVIRMRPDDFVSLDPFASSAKIMLTYVGFIFFLNKKLVEIFSLHPLFGKHTVTGFSPYTYII